ncbi:MAG: hypothetical protein M0C28_08170 [Candidatus Moduliflexus flocculans]|nr:hypothetical protein [Candidatus Moduliflexus flocculans]
MAKVSRADIVFKGGMKFEGLARAGRDDGGPGLRGRRASPSPGTRPWSSSRDEPGRLQLARSRSASSGAWARRSRTRTVRARGEKKEIHPAVFYLDRPRVRVPAAAGSTRLRSRRPWPCPKSATAPSRAMLKTGRAHYGDLPAPAGLIDRLAEEVPALTDLGYNPPILAILLTRGGSLWSSASSGTGLSSARPGRTTRAGREDKVKAVSAPRMAGTYLLTFLAALVTAFALDVLIWAVHAVSVLRRCWLGVGFAAMAFATTHPSSTSPSACGSSSRATRSSIRRRPGPSSLSGVEPEGLRRRGRCVGGSRSSDWPSCSRRSSPATGRMKPRGRASRHDQRLDDRGPGLDGPAGRLSAGPRPSQLDRRRRRRLPAPHLAGHRDHRDGRGPLRRPG